MSQLLKLLTLLALVATLPSPTQPSPTYPYDQPSPASAPETLNDDPLSPLSYSSSPSYEDDLSPDSQYPYKEEDMAPEYQGPSPQAYAPAIEEDYPYAENPSPSPSPAPYLDILAPEAEDIGDDVYYSPYDAPSPSESSYSGVYDAAAGFAPQAHAPPPVIPFHYSAEDDAGYFADDYDEGDNAELKKKNRAVLGFVMGAICLVGLGGLVYKKQKNKKRPHPMYVQLSKKADV